MTGTRFPAILLAAIAAATPLTAAAQCRLCDTPTTTRDEGGQDDDIRLDVETSLNFDRLILFGSGQGTAVIRPDGSSTATGTVAEMSPRAMVGTVVVHGQPGRMVRIDVPRRVELYSIGGGRITFDDLVSDLPSVPRLDSTGALTFRFGGRITITGDSEGQFRGDLPITVEYL
jgi:hypothetical protein